MPNSEAISDAEWVDSLNVNFLSAVRLTYAVLPALREGTSASIINVSAGGALPSLLPLVPTVRVSVVGVSIIAEAPTQ